MDRDKEGRREEDNDGGKEVGLEVRKEVEEGEIMMVGGWEGEREGGKEGGRARWRDGGKEGGREGDNDSGSVEGREGGKERTLNMAADYKMVRVIPL